MIRNLLVAPGAPISEPHLLPPLEAGDRVTIIGRPEPYRSKLPVPDSDIQILMENGPDGSRCVFDARNAVEPTWARYWSSQIGQQGIFTVAPMVDGKKVSNVVISGGKLIGCRSSNAGFTNAAGQKVGWNVMAAGIALYRCEDVVIVGNAIHDNENGVFGKSYGDGIGDLRRITLRWNTFLGNGVPGKMHMHNTYIEGIDTTYEFNRYFRPISGSAGCNLKDRGCRTVVRQCYFEGGERIIDLVDPEDGAPTFLAEPGFGMNEITGCVIYNPAVGGAGAAIHVGSDANWNHRQQRLKFNFNTYVCDRIQSSDYYTNMFRVDETVELYLANNIFHTFTRDGSAPSEFRMVAGKAWLDLQPNYLPAGAIPGEILGQPTNWDTQIRGYDPRFVDAAAGDYRLLSRSPCVGKAVTPWWSMVPPNHAYDPETQGFVPRTTYLDLGGCNTQAVTPPPPKPTGLTFKTIATGIKPAEFGNWPWGIQAVDLGGTTGIVVTDHNTFSRVYSLDGKKLDTVDGNTFRPKVLTGGGLLFRDGKAKSAYRLVDGKYQPIPFSYGEGQPSLPLLTVTPNGFMHNASYGQDLPTGGKWEWNGTTFAIVPYTHRMYSLAAKGVRDYVMSLYANPANRFLRCWWIDISPTLTLLTGHASYGGVMFHRALNEAGIDVTESLGLPGVGTVVHVSPENKTLCINGAGLYHPDSTGRYAKIPGPLRDFLSTRGDYYYHCFVADFTGDGLPDIVVSNPRGRDTRIFQQVTPGEFVERKRIGTWDGEGVAVAQIDGKPCVILGTGDTVVILRPE